MCEPGLKNKEQKKGDEGEYCTWITSLVGLSTGEGKQSTDFMQGANTSPYMKKIQQMRARTKKEGGRKGGGWWRKKYNR